MNAEQEAEDARNNRAARSVVERIMWANVVASMMTFPIILYIYRAYDLIGESLLSIAGWYPEKILIGSISDNAEIGVMTSNAFTILYGAMHLANIRPEIIRDKFDRQDRRNKLLFICAFFYALRLWMLYLFKDEKGIPAAMLIFPSLSIISLSMIIIRSSTVSGETRPPKL